MRMNTARQLLLLAGIGVVAVSHGADDDYLKALRAETQALTGTAAARATSAPATGESKPAPGWSATGQGLGEELPANLSREQFEAALKSSYFGTYMFYTKLSEQDKAVVYTAYQDNGQIANIRDTTTSLLKK